VDVTVRRLAEADVDGVVAVQIAAFDDHDRRWGEPVPETTPERVEAQRRRARHFLTHDPDGSWVADAGGRIVGVALALKRDGLWGLSLLAVAPDAQSRSVGRRLLDAALTYADPDAPAVILSSRDPRAMHRYASAGFALHPQVRATGPVAPSRLRTPEVPVREGTPADFALADEVDVAVRGAPRGPDHEILASQGPMFVVDSGGRRGYAHVHGGRVRTIAATDDTTAAALLWRTLAHACDLGTDATVEHVAGNQQWAVRAIVEAGLSLAPSGPAFWRGRTPPAGYLPSGPYL
jgi:ribosomal protein S18 acetylase RimI-like enzyme